VTFDKSLKHIILLRKVKMDVSHYLYSLSSGNKSKFNKQKVKKNNYIFQLKNIIV